MRIILDLRPDQMAELDKIVAEERVSRAEAIRKAIDVYLRERKRAASRAAFGGWAHKKLDGLKYTQAIAQSGTGVTPMMTWYDDAVRTIVDLPEEQVAALAELCARERISRAEAIRQAVAAMLEERAAKRAARKAALARTFGTWAKYGVDTDTYLAELRSEWDR